MATVGTPGSKTNPYIKDPNSYLDYSEDWSDFLVPLTDTIDSFELVFNDPDTTLEEDLAKHTDDGLIVTFWLSGGRLDEIETVTVRVTTVQGRIDDRTVYFKMRQK